MKQARRTPVPLPGSIVRSKAVVAPVTPALSNEYVDSDDDSDDEDAPQRKSPEMPKTSIAVHRLNGKVIANSKRATTEPSSARQASILKRPIQQPAAKQSAMEKIEINESAARRSEKKSSTESTFKAGSVESVADGDSHSDVASDNSSNSSSDRFIQEIASNINQVPARSLEQYSHTFSHAVDFHPAQIYVAPKGFAALSVSDSAGQKSVRAFECLEGKQIWHITAPTGVSLRDLNELVMGQVSRGEAVFEQKGRPYKFARCVESDINTREVLIPHMHRYVLASAHISQSFSIQAVTSIPDFDTQNAAQTAPSEAVASIIRSTIRAPRQQVEGLRMRFLPPGFNGDHAAPLGNSDSEQETRCTGVIASKKSSIHSENRKHDMVRGSTDSIGLKTHKKHRTYDEKLSREARRAQKAHKRAREAAKPATH